MPTEIRVAGGHSPLQSWLSEWLCTGLANFTAGQQIRVVPPSADDVIDPLIALVDGQADLAAVDLVDLGHIGFDGGVRVAYAGRWDGRYALFAPAGVHHAPDMAVGVDRRITARQFRSSLTTHIETIVLPEPPATYAGPLLLPISRAERPAPPKRLRRLQTFDIETILPAAGQGGAVIIARHGHEAAQRFARMLNHRPSELAARAEMMLAAGVHARLPDAELAAYAQIRSGQLHLNARLLENATALLQNASAAGDIKAPERLAETVLLKFKL